MDPHKAFLAGLIVPAIASPIIIGFLVIQGEVQSIAQLPFIYLGPLLWGVWNILFEQVRNSIPLNDRANKLGAFGALYGLLSALINSFFFEFTTAISILSDSLIVLAIVGYPVLLFFVWKHVVHVLNVYLDAY